MVIDHGCGLQSLYGHLHFTMLLDGIPVNPVEWWDPHWIHDRIEAKLEQYQVLE